MVAKTFKVYEVDADGNRTAITEKCTASDAVYGDSGNLRTEESTHALGADLAGDGKIKSRVHPDDRKDSYTYLNGVYTPDTDPSRLGAFTSGSGEYRQDTITHGTVDYPDGLTNRTTREIHVYDDIGNLLQSETWIYTGSGYETIEWEVRTYDDLGRLKHVYKSTGTQEDTTWDCCGKDSETDAQGIVRYFGYDDLNRLTSETKQDTVADVVTEYTYDAAGRQLSRTVTAGGLSQSNTTAYDLTGRVLTQTDPAGLITGYAYSADGLTTTVTRPGGATEITGRYLDGRIKSVTGTGVADRYYTYGANTDGTQWTTVHNGDENGSNQETTVTDMLGRVVRVEKPGPSGAMVTTNVYDNKGRLASTQTPGQADTLYDYDELGIVIRTGLDLDANGALDTAGTDRISETEQAYVLEEGVWWRESRTAAYATDNDATATTTNIRRSRLTGLGTDGKAGETVDIDIHGNRTVSSMFLDRDTKTRRQTVDYPDSTSDGETVDVNGLVTSITDKTGITRTFQYDALGRRTGVVDPRTGTSETHYNTLGQVDWIEDAADYRTAFAYDPASGRKVAETDAMGGIKRYAYNARGQVNRIWGTAVEPVRYEYDDLGRMAAMHTYRTVDALTGETFDESIAGDITNWHYNSATGLLESKAYPDGNLTAYAYTASGRLFTRSWARTDNGDPLVTHYTLTIQTPANLPASIIPTPHRTLPSVMTAWAARTPSQMPWAARTFAYNDGLQLESETITGSVRRDRYPYLRGFGHDRQE